MIFTTDTIKGIKGNFVAFLEKPFDDWVLIGVKPGGNKKYTHKY